MPRSATRPTIRRAKGMPRAEGKIQRVWARPSRTLDRTWQRETDARCVTSSSDCGRRLTSGAVRAAPRARNLRQDGSGESNIRRRVNAWTGGSVRGTRPWRGAHTERTERRDESRPNCGMTSDARREAIERRSCRSNGRRARRSPRRKRKPGTNIADSRRRARDGAAGQDGNVVLLQPERDVRPGARSGRRSGRYRSETKRSRAVALPVHVT